MAQHVNNEQKTRRRNASQAEKMKNRTARNERRQEDLAAKSAAKVKALEAGLPWDDSIPAAQFGPRGNLEAAFAAATTSDKAAPAEVVKAAEAAVAEKIKQNTATTETPAAETPEQETPAATETPESKPVEEIPAVNDDATEQPATEAPTEQPATTEAGATQTPPKKLNRKERRRLEAEARSKAIKEPPVVETPPVKSAEESAAVFAAMDETSRNGEPPKADDEQHVDDDLVKHGSFAATDAATKAADELSEDNPAGAADPVKPEETPTEAPVADQPAQDVPTEAPVEETPAPAEETPPAPVEQPTTTEAPAAPVEQTEAKPSHLTVVASNDNPKPPKTSEKKKGGEQPKGDMKAAQAFYGVAWANGNTKLLMEAHYFLTMALRAEEILLKDKDDKDAQGKLRMGLNMALKKEAEAFAVVEQAIAA